eukprot:2795896-Rhodomonas_salina.2
MYAPCQRRTSQHLPHLAAQEQLSSMVRTRRGARRCEEALRRSPYRGGDLAEWLRPRRTRAGLRRSGPGSAATGPASLSQGQPGPGGSRRCIRARYRIADAWGETGGATLSSGGGFPSRQSLGLRIAAMARKPSKLP